jgi:hypothetical protein
LGKTAQARGAYPANHVSIANKTPKEADFKRPAVWQQFNSTPPRDNLSTNDLGVKITEEFNRASDNAQEKEAFLSRYKSQRIDIINNDERIRNPAAPAVYGSSEGGILFAVENSGYNFVFPYFKLNFTETIKEDLKSVFDIQDDSTSSNFVQFEVILPALFQKWNSGWQLVSQGKLRLF